MCVCVCVCVCECVCVCVCVCMCAYVSARLIVAKYILYICIANKKSITTHYFMRSFEPDLDVTE